MVNCGLPATSRETWRQVARATAAHSTVDVQRHLVVPLPRRRLVQAPARHADRQRPADVQVAREERDDAVILRASHDGYADRFGDRHQRALKLAPDGNRLDGEDLFVADRWRHACRRDVADEFAVRFHLHPSVKANQLTDGHGAMLMLPNKDVWTFNAYEDRVEIEESVYLAGADGPRRAVQIVIYGRARKMPRVHWTFAHHVAPAPAPAASRARSRNCRLSCAVIVRARSNLPTIAATLASTRR